MANTINLHNLIQASLHNLNNKDRYDRDCKINITVFLRTKPVVSKLRPMVHGETQRILRRLKKIFSTAIVLDSDVEEGARGCK